MKSIPQLYLYNQNKKDCIGIVKGYTEFTEDIRFNACSEISFTIPRDVYDIERETWAVNPIYDSIEKRRLLFLADDNEYFSFPPRQIGDSSYYTHILWDNRPYDRPYEMRYPYNSYLEHFQVQDEVELFDCGTGYKYHHFGLLNENGFYDNSGNLWSNASLTRSADRNTNLAEKEFIPVSANDTIAFYTGKRLNSEKATFKWRVMAYTENDASTYVPTTANYTWCIDRPNTSKRVQVKEKLPNGGYIRIWVENSHGNRTTGTNYITEDNTGSAGYSYNTDTGAGSCYWTPPTAGYIKVFSGERRCTSIDNVKDGDSYIGDPLSPKMRWFEIVSVEEENDGFSCKKKVTAYSYEYSLSHTTFSISENTLPLYIPDAILNMVNNSSNQWIIEKAYIGDGSYVTTYGTQSMQKGILNEILSYLPNWKIGYVSSELMTRYRSLGDADNIDVYSYLMDTIQSVYNCFIVFDNDEMTISAYSLNDINNLQSNVHLTWNNAIQHFDKANIDASYFTALRVVAGDNQYGIGLVNPTGNGLVYNFDRLLPYLDYKIEGAGAYQRLLSDAVSSWITEYTSQLTSTYQTSSKQFIQANMDVIKAESDVSIALSEYKSVRDQICVLIKNSGGIPQISERYEPANNIKRASASAYYNAQYQYDLANASEIYADAKSRLATAQAAYTSAESSLRDIAKKLTLNYSQALKANNGNEYVYSSSTTLLSAAEIKEIMKYIVEGLWNYENATFRDEYGVDDVYSTLYDVLSEANYDLKHRLSIANFDFTIESANITVIPDFEKDNNALRLGQQVCLYVGGEECVLTPMLLEIHVNYKDPNDFRFTFTTDTKRKPMQFRFADLYSTIQQTSVTNKSFTFDT